MTKKVIISIKGLQYVLSEGEDQRVETLNRGEFYTRNGKHYVVYDEVIEGTTEVTNNMLKFNSQMLEVIKRGIYGVHLIFEKGKKNLTSYNTPFGNLMVGIDTKTVTVNEDDNEIKLCAQYSMEINYDFVADCTIDILIKSISEKDT